MSAPAEFDSDEPVYVDRTNCAHALTTDGQLTQREQMVCMGTFPIGSTWCRALGEVILARQDRPRAFVAAAESNAWPCQTCVRMVSERQPA